MKLTNLLFCMVTLLSTEAIARADDLGEHGFVNSGGVQIHYVTAGEGPLVVMLHGFPDFWFTWRKQIPAIAKNHQVVAIDLRGFNKSDKPEGVENYAMPKLVGDVEAVIKHFGRTKATVVGHDWGGMVTHTIVRWLSDQQDESR